MNRWSLWERIHQFAPTLILQLYFYCCLLFSNKQYAVFKADLFLPLIDWHWFGYCYVLRFFPRALKCSWNALPFSHRQLLWRYVKRFHYCIGSSLRGTASQHAGNVTVLACFKSQLSHEAFGTDQGFGTIWSHIFPLLTLAVSYLLSYPC